MLLVEAHTLNSAIQDRKEGICTRRIMYQAVRADSRIAHIHCLSFRVIGEGKINRKGEIIASLKSVFEWNQTTSPFFQQKLLST